ncbi:DUF916 domain-containing protein [Vagococcus sp. BWB3-3]|uniref:DUF916 domain-containing protein n=1 Tax=Vagococcus allomyrinae TaxID=2794353 RepID=A0A940SUK7_9ENTE|nr:DUF916 domain-containing protein [Vagococcus allomyrinae]MBP1039448.1 DUF916 domain-containing protein [Vagococcus allomyrinae]
MSFTYVNKVPENQIKKGNFFDLMMSKGQEQVLETELTNLTDQDLTINVIVSNATTTEGGVIDYGPSEQLNTENLAYGLTDLIEAPASVKLPKNGRAVLKLTLKMPDESVSGVILGGVQLQQEIDKAQASNGAVSINNQYAYVYSISLREREEVPALDFISEPTAFKNKQVVFSFSNQAARIVKEMTVEMVVTPKDSAEVLGETRLEKLKMAPNSIIKLPLNVDLSSGDYQTKTTVTVDDKSWQWVEDFTVQVETSTPKVVEKTSETEARAINWLPVGIIASLLIVGTGILYIVFVRN